MKDNICDWFLAQLRDIIAYWCKSFSMYQPKEKNTLSYTKARTERNDMRISSAGNPEATGKEYVSPRCSPSTMTPDNAAEVYAAVSPYLSQVLADRYTSVERFAYRKHNKAFYCFDAIEFSWPLGIQGSVSTGRSIGLRWVKLVPLEERISFSQYLKAAKIKITEPR